MNYPQFLTLSLFLVSLIGCDNKDEKFYLQNIDKAKETLDSCTFDHIKKENETHDNSECVAANSAIIQHYLLGDWINESNDCSSFCSFKIIKKANFLSDYFVDFDNNSIKNISSGPLIQVDKNIFLINTRIGNMPFSLINNNLYFKDNSIYEKNEDRYHAYLINEIENIK